MCVAIVATAGTAEPGVRALVRATARSSVLILCLALASFAVAGLAHRRTALVRALAVSHGIHLAAVLWLAAVTHGANLHERAAIVNVVGGVLAYVVIFAGLFRPRHPLVEWGLAWVAVSFLFSYGVRAVDAPLVYGPVVAAILVCLALRVAAPFVRPAVAKESCAA
jgi:hypothetical protein